MSFIAFLVPFSMLDLQEWKYEYEFIFIPDVLLRAESEAAWNWPNCRHDTSETGSQERGVHLKPVFCSYKHEGTNVWKIVVIVRPCKASLIGDDVRLYDFKLWAVTLSPSQKGREQRNVQEQGSRQKWVAALFILQCHSWINATFSLATPLKIEKNRM